MIFIIFNMDLSIKITGIVHSDYVGICVECGKI